MVKCNGMGFITYEICFNHWLHHWLYTTASVDCAFKILQIECLFPNYFLTIISDTYEQLPFKFTSLETS